MRHGRHFPLRSGERGYQAREMFEQLAGVARNVHNFLPACGAGNNCQIAARQLPSPGQKLQQRLVGAAVLGRFLDTHFDHSPTPGSSCDPDHTVYPSPRPEVDCYARAIARGVQRGIRQNIRISDCE